MEKKKIIFTISFIFVLFLNSGHSLANSDSGLKFFKNSSITRNGWDYYRNEAAGDSYGIKWVMNVSRTEIINFTSISDQYYNISKSITFHIEEAYQNANSITYIPESYGLRFKDKFGNEKSTINSSLSFFLDRVVNKTSGIIFSAKNPFDAASVQVVAYYDTSDPIYTTTWSPLKFSEVGSLNSEFYANVTDWSLNNLAFPTLRVEEEDTFENFDTYVIRNTEDEPDTIQSVSQIQVEKTTGLRVLQQVLLVKLGVYTWEIRLFTSNIGGLILGYQNGQSSPFLEFPLIVSILILYSLSRKKL